MSQIKNYTPLSYSYATPASMLGPEQEVDLGQPSRAMFPHSAIPLSPKLSLSQMSPRPSQRPSPLVPSSEALLPSLVSSPPSITLNTHDRLPNRQTSLNINSTPRLLPCQPSTLDALLQPSMLSVETPTFSPPLKQTLPIPTAELPLDVLAASRRWIYTFALINFDLDEGPDFDNCYPRANFTSAQLSNIAFSSFPDCAQIGSLMFNWRIPVNSHATSKLPSATVPTPVTSPKPNLRPLASWSPSKNRLSPNEPTIIHPSHVSPISDSDLHGYVYFLQEKDPSVPRGYNQNSLVLITHLPDYAGLFSTLISRLGPLYAARGAQVLEQALQNIAQWPDPTPGTMPELPFLDEIYTFALPLAHQAQLLEPRSQTGTSIHSETLASPPPTYFSSILFGGQGQMSLSSVWLLWEIIILAEPLVVFGSSPDIVSNTVVHLRNLIRPAPFQGDWRPYITIHDPDFPNLFKSKARTGALIGATNPIILSNTQYWPHVLCLSTKQGTFGLTTERKRHLHKDKNTIKQLESCIERKDYHQADVILSRHFALLTEQFLQPLQRYFTTLLPHDTSLSQPQRPSSFNQDVFLKSLKAHATLLEFRFKLSAGLSSSISAFYTKFLRSPNFASWLHSQIDAAAAAIRTRYLDRLQSPIELDSWAQGKTQEQIHELLERIESEMILSDRLPPSHLSSPSKLMIDLHANSGDLSHPSSPISSLNLNASSFVSPGSISPPTSQYRSISPPRSSESDLLRVERLRAQAERLRSISQRS